MSNKKNSLVNSGRYSVLGVGIFRNRKLLWHAHSCGYSCSIRNWSFAAFVLRRVSGMVYWICHSITLVRFLPKLFPVVCLLRK